MSLQLESHQAGFVLPGRKSIRSWWPWFLSVLTSCLLQSPCEEGRRPTDCLPTLNPHRVCLVAGWKIKRKERKGKSNPKSIVDKTKPDTDTNYNPCTCLTLISNSWQHPRWSASGALMIKGWLRSRILPISIQHADWFAQCSPDHELTPRAMNETWDAAHGIISDKYSYLDPLRGPRVSGIEGLRNRNPLHELIKSGDDKSISYHCVILMLSVSWICNFICYAKLLFTHSVAIIPALSASSMPTPRLEMRKALLQLRVGMLLSGDPHIFGT